MRSFLITLGAVLLAAQPDLCRAADFAAEVKPLLEEQCLMCHKEDRPLGGVRVDTKEETMKAVTPGKPEDSVLYTCLDPEAENLMPPGRPLSAAQRAVIREWIEEGAKWPDGETIGAAPKKSAGEDDAALAKAIAERIAKTSPIGLAMAAYESKIPGTEVSFEMTPIEGGEFLMGSPESEPKRTAAEGTRRKVRVDPFWMMTTEVTWDLYRLFMFSDMAREEDNPDELVDAISRPTRPYVEMSFGMGIDGYPAISMTQHAALKFAQWLSAKTGQFLRLPTEAEWEYACRAGTTTAYSFGDDPAVIGEYAWYWDNSGAKYGKVGEKKPNPWGLHDMHGNVMEWTLDTYDEKGYPAADGVLDNPWVKAKKLYPRAVRGGSWNDDPDKLRCAARRGSDPEWKMQDPQLPKSVWYHTDAVWLGLRLVRPLKTPSADEMYAVWNSGLASK